MKSSFIVNKYLEELIIIFTGWSTTPKLYKEFKTNLCDLLIVYDYSNLELFTDIILKYKTINVIGWSLGVWAASYYFSNNKTEKINKTVAINGTPYPIDNEYGINKQLFINTAKNLNEQNLKKFQFRMCNTKTAFEEFNIKNEKVDIEHLRKELFFINENIDKNVDSFFWQKAYIGINDRIFLPKNQQNAWNENTYKIIVDVAHYDLELLQKIVLDIA